MPVDVPTGQPGTESPPPRHLRRHIHATPRSWLPRVVAAAAWVVIAALLVVVAIRLVAWDTYQPFAVLNSVTMFVYLPAWIIVGAAIVGRRPLLAVAALVVIAAQIAFLEPELGGAQPVPSWTAGAPAFRLFDANVYAGNPSMSGYNREIIARRPDLVTLEEANPTDVAQLQRGGALAGLPYRIELNRRDPTALLIASRYPLAHSNAIYAFGRPLIVQTTVTLPSGAFDLWVVHTIAPLPSSFPEWTSQLATIDHYLRLRGTHRLLVVGDLNATWGNRGFRKLLDLGLSDGAAVRGRALDMTWSQLEWVIPPLVRIDHALTGPGIAVTGITTAPGSGSDHRALAATVAVRR
jgi:endonuclease/exonuclease/phosphatase family metal-dependent hydrolase